MRRLIYTPLARRDLIGIHGWSRRQFGLTQTEEYIRQIDSQLTRAAEIPALLRDAGDVRPGLMKLAVGSHMAFLRLDADQLHVIRILHGRMDPERWV